MDIKASLLIIIFVQNAQTTRAVVLDLWVPTPLGKVKQPLHRGLLRPLESIDIYMITNSSKISYKVAVKIILWVGLGGGSPQHEELYKTITVIGPLRTTALEL